MCYKVLSVSHDRLVGHWQQSVLESNGYTAIPAMDAAEATPWIRGAGVDAILLGSAVRVEERTSLALLGVTSDIPVVCACGLLSDEQCPIVHVPPSEPTQLLAAISEVVRKRPT